MDYSVEKASLKKVPGLSLHVTEGSSFFADPVTPVLPEMKREIRLSTGICNLSQFQVQMR